MAKEAILGNKLYDMRRRPEAIANLLRWIAATLEVAQEERSGTLYEKTADAGRKKVCPVYPFD